SVAPRCLSASGEFRDRDQVLEWDDLLTVLPTALVHALAALAAIGGCACGIERLARDLKGLVLRHTPGFPDRPRLLDDQRCIPQPARRLVAIGSLTAKRLRQNRRDVPHLDFIAREWRPPLLARLVAGADGISAP